MLRRWADTSTRIVKLKLKLALKLTLTLGARSGWGKCKCKCKARARASVGQVYFHGKGLRVCPIFILRHSDSVSIRKD